MKLLILLTILVLLLLMAPTATGQAGLNPIVPGGIHDIWPQPWNFGILIEGYWYPCPRYLLGNPVTAALNCYWPVKRYYPYPWLVPSPSPAPETGAVWYPPPDTSPKVLTYTVETGDNWYRIASKLWVDVNRLWEVNQITNPNAHIHAGNVFIVP